MKARFSIDNVTPEETLLNDDDMTVSANMDEMVAAALSDPQSSSTLNEGPLHFCHPHQLQAPPSLCPQVLLFFHQTQLPQEDHLKPPQLVCLCEDQDLQPIFT